jgi:hypothetical protein
MRETADTSMHAEMSSCFNRRVNSATPTALSDDGGTKMKAEKIPAAQIEWEPAIEMFGERTLCDGHPLTEWKLLSDRRGEGGGIACLIRFTPPPGKILKVVATARSDEHVYLLEGGNCNKAGARITAPGTYGINAQGRPHSAFFAEATTAMVIYRGEPDDVHELEVIEPSGDA